MESWCGVEVEPFELEQLEAVGRELDAEHERRYEVARTKSERARPPQEDPAGIGLDPLGKDPQRAESYVENLFVLR